MKSFLSKYLIYVLLMACSSVIWAQENVTDEIEQLVIDKIITDCENQFDEQTYSDIDERNKLIDQCVDDLLANQPSGNSEQTSEP